ncbi:MoaD/ThiS family protein [Maricaulis sp.]|jgi:molybdopterin synthase sulfur carrier subunit|uniref:MoaD/ThiS family protein n=1 Tax=Maricaulis sp. TaxID=1486257 RepID=UPI00260C7D05|nr:MoaD/ThiS family protein [Maricaulis sp.]
MKLTVRYVAALRDRMGRAEADLDLPEGIADSEALIGHLRAAEPAAEALSHPSVRLILNDAIVPRPAPLSDGDTLAFCPPFTGG